MLIDLKHPTELALWTDHLDWYVTFETNSLTGKRARWELTLPIALTLMWRACNPAIDPAKSTALIGDEAARDEIHSDPGRNSNEPAEIRRAITHSATHPYTVSNWELRRSDERSKLALSRLLIPWLHYNRSPGERLL